MWREALCLALYLALAGGAGPLGARAQAPSLPVLPLLPLDGLAPTVRTAIQEAYDAVQAHPLEASANGKLGMVLHAHNLLAEAEVCYQRAHLLDPTSFRWAYYLGLVQMGQARKLYEEILQKHPDSPEAHYGLGRVRAANKDLSGAVESFQKACQLFPPFAAAHHALARTYQRLGKANQAQEELTLSKKSEGAFPEAEDELLAEVQTLYRDFDAYLKLGAELASKGDSEQAAAAYERALEINPQLPEAHVRLIYLCGQLGQAAKAEEHYRAALRLDPGKPDAYFYYGALIMGQGKSREAEDAFRKVLEINPHHTEAHNNLGYLLEGRGELPKAIAEFRQALEKNPDFPQAHFNLGRILVKQENYEEGIPHLLKALTTENEETRTSYLQAIGIAFASFGDLENALSYLHLAREKAAARNQTSLMESIDDDLRLLEGNASPPSHRKARCSFIPFRRAPVRSSLWVEAESTLVILTTPSSQARRGNMLGSMTPNRGWGEG